MFEKIADSKLSLLSAQYPLLNEEGAMYEPVENGFYRFVIRVRVPGIDTPRRRVLVEKCTSDKKAADMVPVLKERVRAELTRSLTVTIKTLRDAIGAYRSANPGAKWGADRYAVALAWAGDLGLDKTIMVEFDNVIRMYGTTKTKHKDYPADSTVNKLIGICKTATRYCYLNYLADRDWLGGYKKIREFNERAVYVTRDMFDAIIAELPENPTAWGPLIRAAYFTGMRQGELRGLKMSQVDLFKQRINLLTSKTGRPRVVPFDKELAPYFASRSTAEYAFEVNGRPLAKRQVCQAWQRAAKKAKLPEVRLHDLRGTFGTDLIESGVPQKVVMEIMGHFSFTSFLRYQKMKHDCQLDQALEARRTGHYQSDYKTTTKQAGAL